MWSNLDEVIKGDIHDWDSLRGIFEHGQIEDEDCIMVDAKVANPLHHKKMVKAEFLVDTGANGCAISQELADKLELKSCGTVEAVLADGSVKRVSAAYIVLEIAGRKLYAWSVIDSGFQPILGVDVMDVLDVHIDVPKRKVLIPLKRLKPRLIRLSFLFSLKKAYGRG